MAVRAGLQFSNFSRLARPSTPTPPPSPFLSLPPPSQWVLGFLAPPPPDATALLRHRFQSKLGGRPAWLDPVHLPPPSALTCGVTGAPLDFLLQVYAPVDGVEEAFHRVLYIFVSPEVRRWERERERRESEERGG